MFFPDLPIFDEFSYVFNVLMDFVVNLWDYLNMPIYNSSDEVYSLIESLFVDVPDWVLNIFDVINVVQFNSVPVLHYSLLEFLITNLVVVILLFWVVKFFRSLV